MDIIKILRIPRGDILKGLVLDMNTTDAFIAFDDGTTSYMGTSHLPKGVKIGDTINTDRESQAIINDKISSAFWGS